MAISVVLKEGLHFCSETPSGKLMCDESSEVGAAYPSSPELLLAALGSCIGSVLYHFTQRHDISIEGLKIDLDYEIVDGPRRIGNIDIKVSFAQDFTPEQLALLERAAHACLIHNTLTNPPQIKMTVSGGAEK